MPLKRVRTYFCESSSLGEWVKQPLFPIIGSRCSQKWLLISLLRVFEHAYRKSFLPSPTLSEAKSRFILAFRRLSEAKNELRFGSPDTQEAKNESRFRFPDTQKAKNESRFGFPDTQKAKNESRFWFTECR